MAWQNCCRHRAAWMNGSVESIVATPIARSRRPDWSSPIEGQRYSQVRYDVRHRSRKIIICAYYSFNVRPIPRTKLRKSAEIPEIASVGLLIKRKTSKAADVQCGVEPQLLWRKKLKLTYYSLKLWKCIHFRSRSDVIFDRQYVAGTRRRAWPG